MLLLSFFRSLCGLGEVDKDLLQVEVGALGISDNTYKTKRMKKKVVRF